MEKDRIRKSRLEQLLHTKYIGREVICHDSVDSTNLEIKRLGFMGASHGCMVVADMQTAGIGRRGRSWSTSPGEMISMSILLRPNIDTSQASMITLVMAVSVAEALEAVCSVKTAIKWPNDILISGRKICGILTEMTLVEKKIDQIVMGVGINVNNSEFPDEIKMTATSLLNETGQSFSRDEIIASIAERFENNYDDFLTRGNLSGILEPYQSRLVNRNEKVRVLEPSGEFQGISSGINEKGELLVTKEDGELINVYAGEVSVRGIYGYI